MQKSKLGLENPIDMVYHVQPWMIVPILPLAIGFEGRNFYALLSPEWNLLHTNEGSHTIYLILFCGLDKFHKVDTYWGGCVHPSACLIHRMHILIKFHVGIAH